VAPSGSLLFTVNFAPTVAGSTTGYLRATYQIQQPGCSFTSGVNPCPSTVDTATLTGTATDPKIVLSYKNSSGTPVVLQPASSTAFDFGNVSTSSSVTVTFLLSNQTSGTLPTPVIKLQGAQFFSSAFRLDVSVLPASITGNSFATFTVTFAPGQLGVTEPLSGLLIGTLINHQTCAASGTNRPKNALRPNIIFHSPGSAAGPGCGRTRRRRRARCSAGTARRDRRNCGWSSARRRRR